MVCKMNGHFILTAMESRNELNLLISIRKRTSKESPFSSSWKFNFQWNQQKDVLSFYRNQHRGAQSLAELQISTLVPRPWSITQPIKLVWGYSMDILIGSGIGMEWNGNKMNIQSMERNYDQWSRTVLDIPTRFVLDIFVEGTITWKYREIHFIRPHQVDSNQNQSKWSVKWMVTLYWPQWNQEMNWICWFRSGREHPKRVHSQHRGNRSVHSRHFIIENLPQINRFVVI